MSQVVFIIAYYHEVLIFECNWQSVQILKWGCYQSMIGKRV